MNYFMVAAKCGHVGRHNYIEKIFYVKANDAKNAAYRVRYFPRVKHDRKDAILQVVPITEAEYIAGREQHDNDLYFRVHSSTEQRLYECVHASLIIPETSERRQYKRRTPKSKEYYSKLERIVRRDTLKRMGEVNG